MKSPPNLKESDTVQTTNRNDSPSQTVDPATPPESQTPRSIAVASRGVRTDRQALNLLEAIIQDTLDDKSFCRQAGVVCNAMGKMLKVAEMRHKYAHPDKPAADFDLLPTAPEAESVPCLPDPREERRLELRRQLAELDASDEAAKGSAPLPRKG